MKRYELFPQMVEYDKMGFTFKPFVMFTNKVNYKSKYINTDKYGIRPTNNPDMLFMAEKCYEHNVFIGGSTAFGVGASHDYTTIPSLLKERFINLGGRAYQSTQEYLHFTFHENLIPNINKVVIFSGLNNLIFYYLLNNQDSRFGSFYYNDIYLDKMMNISRKVWLKNILFKKRRNKIVPDRQTVIDILERDLGWWGKRDLEIYYFMQPFANWVSKPFTKDEKELFQELDNTSKQWRVLSKEMDNDHEWYVGAIEGICKKNNIKFMDLNIRPEINKSKECIFVDRIHLTDWGNKIVAGIIEEQIND